MGFFSESKPEPRERLICDKPLHCLICRHDRFYQREAQLNTAAASFFGFDFANQSGTCLVCAECGYIHWFVR